MRVDQEVPFRLWAPGRLHAFVSLAVVAAVGLTPGVAYAVPAAPSPTASIGTPVPAAEGEALRFPVTLAEAPDASLTLLLSTTDAGSAAAGDINALYNQPLTFEPDGELTQYVEVSTRPDNEDEGTDADTAETVELKIVDFGAATPGPDTATGKIIDAVISVEPVDEITETDGPTTESFDINLNVAFQRDTSVTYAIAAHSSTSGGADETLLAFPAGVTTKRVTIDIAGDDLYERADRKIDVTLAHFTGDGIGIRGLGTTSFPFPEDEPLPEIESVTVGGPVTEDDDETVTVTVKLTGRLAYDGVVTVDDVAGGTAKAAVLFEDGQVPLGQDDFEVAGSLTIPAGSDTGTIDVMIKDDEVFERTEEIKLVMSGGQEPHIADASESVTITVVDDDPQPVITFDGFEANEGAEDVPVSFSVSGAFEGPLPWTAEVGPDLTDERYPIFGDDIDKTGLELAGGLPSDATKIDLGSLDVPLGSADEYDEHVKFSVKAAGVDEVSEFGVIHDDPNHLPPELRAMDARVLEGGTAKVSPVWHFNHDGNTATTSEREVKVDFRTSSGTAEQGTDFTATSGTLPTDDVFWAMVPTAADQDEEGSENFTVTLSNPVNATIGDDTATVTIAESIPTVSVGDAAPVAESDELEFPVTLSEPAPDPVTVTVATSDATANAGPDYEAIVRQVDFAAGESTAVVKVATQADSLTEGEGETVHLKILDPGGVSLGNERSEGRILDPVLTVTSDGAVGEGDSPDVSTEYFDLTLNKPLGADLNFEYRVVAGTATADEDIDEVSAMPVTIAAGQTSARIAVKIRGDDVHEDPDETFTIVLTSLSDTVLGDREHPFVIADDDVAAPTVNLGDAVAVPEGGVLKFPVTLGAPSDAPVSVRVGTTGGTAVAGDDYTAVTGKEVTFAPGVTTATVEVATTADGTAESDPETVTLELTDAGDAVAGTATGTGKIVDGAVTLTPVGEIVEGNSGGREQLFDVTLNVAVDAEVTLDYEILDDTTTSGGVDIDATSGTLTFAPNATKQQIIVPVYGDADDEGAGEVFKIRLSNLTGLQASGLGEHPFTLIDDDGAPSIVSVSSVSQPEGDGAGTATYTVKLSNPALGTTVLDVTGAGGTAVQPAGGVGAGDYTTPATVTFSENETSKTFDVTVDGDTVLEGDETASIVVTPREGDPNVAGGAQSGTLTLVNDDDPPTITVNGFTKPEGSLGVAVTATVTGDAQAPIVWRATATGGSDGSSDPAEPEDFDATNLITYGDLAPGTRTLDLGTIGLDQGTADEFDETVKIGVTLEGSETATGFGVIQDFSTHLPPGIHTPASVTATENGTVTIPVGLDFEEPLGTTADATEKTITADYTFTPGSATAGDDYDATPGQVTFPPGQTTRTITVPIPPDLVADAGETFTVTVGNALNAASGAGSSTTVTIDEAGPAHTFTVTPDVTAAEGQPGAAEFAVRLDAPAVEDVDLTVTAADGTARRGAGVPGGDDFTTPNGTLRILKGQQTGTVSVPILDDDVYEENETAEITVAVAPGETAAAGDPRTAALAVTDDDPVPTLTLNDAASGAEGGTVDVIATPSGVAEDPIGYLLRLGGDAANGADAAEIDDFTGGTVDVTVPGGSTAPVTLHSIALRNDAVDEAGETIKAVLERVTTPGSPVEARYRITDDPRDLPPAVSIGGATVSEAQGLAEVPVTLDFLGGNGATSTEQPVSVTFDTFGETADTTDFEPPYDGNTLIVPAGQRNGVIRVPIVNDRRAENPETFYVRLLSAAPEGAGLSGGLAGVVIDDDDANAPRPEFTVSGDVTAGEAGGSATFEIRLSEPAPGDMDLDVAVEPGTATPAGAAAGETDFENPPATVRIPAGAVSAQITVPIRPDEVYEGDETAVLTAALAAGGLDAAGSSQRSTLTITDDDPKPSITLAETAATVAEGGSFEVVGTVHGTAQRDVEIGGSTTAAAAAPGVRTQAVVKIKKGEKRKLVVERKPIVRTLAGEDAEPADYDLGDGFVIPAGTPSGSRLSLGTIRFRGDGIDEDDETATISFGGSVLTFTITDDPADQPPTVSVGDVSAGEDDTAAEVPVTLGFRGDATSTERTVTVPWQTVDGTADAGEDYRGAGGTVTIDPLAGSATIRVPLLDDARDEKDQAFTVRLGTPAPAGVTVTGGPGTVTITDDDKPKAPTLTAPAIIVGAGRPILQGVAAAGAKVELLSAGGASGGTFKVIGSTVADDDGAYSFEPNIGIGVRFQTRAAGLSSPVRAVQIRQEPVVTVVSGARGQATVTVVGDPDEGGQTVRVQRRIRGEWREVDDGRLGPRGRFATTVRGLTSGGTAVFRAVITATPSLGILAGASAARTVKVK
ncbi:Calx-beta domain-containing protein [Actinoplanes utahensis]|uniref:Calx-beta domain-containing protein n=1 Tax=Actinoplanes utahensis TaxID=1869 RepID=A0A0A6UTS2_ACTUT|nr:Calx-beta domain-containing protein [Actinoplanes utahensis]KHD78368.1 hypothetical protein MB27_05940 [Actinoplanes utahensis]GIF28984.1 hypothetical protein Aut01nite_19700 [Actinoplanes utahensis]